MTDQELDDIAGEYVLGTLPADERAAFEVRLQNDAGLRAKVDAWTQRLAPLDDALHDEEMPGGHVWAGINQRLANIDAARQSSEPPPAPDDGAGVVGFNDFVSFIAMQKMRESRDRWRRLAIGTLTLAAGFIGLAALGVSLPFLPGPQQEAAQFVAVLNPQGAEPGFLIRVDIETKRLQIERLAGKAPAGKDYELWLIEPDNQIRSLDVVGREKVQRVGYKSGEWAQNISFAISLEPAGGSPTGVATGPILWTGRLLTEE